MMSENLSELASVDSRIQQQRGCNLDYGPPLCVGCVSAQFALVPYVCVDSNRIFPPIVFFCCSSAH